jgi:hypothetical protein
MSRPARIVQFQVYFGVMYILDDHGVIWRNSDPESKTSVWSVVLGPTLHQHQLEDGAILERQNVFDISEKK